MDFDPISSLIAVVYGLVELIKFIIKRAVGSRQRDEHIEFQMKTLQKLEALEEQSKNNSEHHLTLLLALKDITHSLKDISKSQAQLAEVLKDLKK